MLISPMISPITKNNVDRILKDLKRVQAEVETDGMEFDYSFAFEIAKNLIDDNPGLKEYIEKEIGVSDCVGWLANQF